MKKITYAEAINEALHEEFRRDDKTVHLATDMNEALLAEFGEERVRGQEHSYFRHIIPGFKPQTTRNVLHTIYAWHISPSRGLQIQIRSFSSHLHLY